MGNLLYTDKKIPTNLPEIPLAGSDDPRVNLAKLAKLRGSYYLNDLCKETGLSVFRLKLFEERVILADPVAIRVIYDTTLTEKSHDFGLAMVNGFNLRGYFPTANVNGSEKATKKEGICIEDDFFYFLGLSSLVSL